ncbi:TonB dependent receptor [Tellurirhabdus rosea]|uniref:TonB dependent receptor n=1 Tax=Tellurirhabdus rosea TaxID=2674997 RepID=UPI0022572372|nr:TonB dependent receptor [Tellurirhabdus rosea]
MNKLYASRRAGMTALFFGLLSAALAQTPGGTVSGEVKDAAGGPLEFATLLLVRATDSTLVKGEVSDAAGVYRIDGVGAGQYRIAATLVGYRKTFSEPFTLTAEKPGYTVPVLTVAQESRTLGEVKVTAKKPFIEQHPDKTVVNVENSIVATGGTALEVLEKAPGVVVDQQNDVLKLKGQQGVLVMIDGKPSYLSAAEVMNLLRNTPSSSVQSIELITKPSSRYDAAGNSGIINIRLKRNNTPGGTNGSFTLGGGYGRYPKATTGLTLNHRSGNLSLFGSYNYDFRKGWGSIDVLRWLGKGTDTTFTVRNLGYRPNEARSHVFKAGADYAFGSRTSLGLMVNGTLADNRAQINNSNLVYSPQGTLQSSTTFINTSSRNTERFVANVNFRHQFDSTGRVGGPRELTLDADYSRVNIDPYDLMTTRQYSAGGEPVGQPLLQRNTSPSEVTVRAAKLDYVHPFGKDAKLEAGWKSSYVTTDNNVLFENQNAGGWTGDPRRSNHFIYDETIHAAYVNGNRTLGPWTVQAGLRLEATDSRGNSITMNRIVDRQYVNLFPSLFVTRNLGKDHQLRYSYSRRIDRPSYFDLNPFIYVMDVYTYREGNPFLKPQYTNAFELAYTYKGESTVSLSYNRTTDVITQGLEQLGEQMRQTTVNLGLVHNYNLSLQFPLTITSWWNARQSVDVSTNIYNATYLGERLDRWGLGANFTTNHSFVLPHGLTAELSAFYNTPFTDGMFRGRGFGQFDFGAQKSLWNKRGTLRLNVTDPLLLNKFRGEVENALTHMRFTNRRESRTLRLTFTWNFGNSKIKVRQRKSGSEEEQRRIQ